MSPRFASRITGTVGMVRVDVVDQRCKFAFGTDCAEMGDLRFERAHDVSDRVDDPTTERAARHRRVETGRHHVRQRIETHAHKRCVGLSRRCWSCSAKGARSMHFNRAY